MNAQDLLAAACIGAALAGFGSTLTGLGVLLVALWLTRVRLKVVMYDAEDSETPWKDGSPTEPRGRR